MIDFQALRNKILDKAIRGELVPQLESEPEIVQFGRTPEDVPFPIPSKWKWMSLVEILLEISDGSHNPPPNSGQGIPVLSAKNVNNGVIDAQGVTRWVTEEQWLIEDKKIHIEPGDVLLTIVGSIGRTAVVPDGAAKFMLQRSVCIMKPKTFLDSEFLALMLTSSALFEWMMDRASGTAQKGIYLKTVKAMPFPVPPFSEQQRIVAKTKKIFEQINRAESAYDELSGPLANRFRQLCLEKAIQGRLVPQLESEPEVSLIGEPPANIPFAIPKKWKWVKLGNAFHLKTGKFISADRIKGSGAYPCYGGNGKRGYVNEFNRQGRFPLIGRQGALCGNINLVDGKFYATEHAVVADGGNLVDPDCAALFLESLNLNQYATKTAQPGLSVKRISETPYPLPPLAEQKRISNKIKNLFLILKQIDH